MGPNPLSEESLHALADIRDIRSMMERSTRFISLSGWSGVWAGCVALAGAAMAFLTLRNTPYDGDTRQGMSALMSEPLVVRLTFIAVLAFFVALCGALYFTWRKAHANGQQMWTRPARQFMLQVTVPMLAGGVFCAAFLVHRNYQLIAPGCLVFYGLALVNAAKHTLGEIRWLGYSELALGCVALLLPFHSLAFLACGFGLLHIGYGVAMWNKYG